MGLRADTLEEESLFLSSTLTALLSALTPWRQNSLESPFVAWLFHFWCFARHPLCCLIEESEVCASPSEGFAMVSPGRRSAYCPARMHHLGAALGRYRNCSWLSQHDVAYCSIFWLAYKVHTQTDGFGLLTRREIGGYGTYVLVHLVLGLPGVVLGDMV